MTSHGWNLKSSYTSLPETFYRFVRPRQPSNPSLVFLNENLCATLGLQAAQLTGRLGAELLSGYRLPPGSQPYAQAYAGHQFGHFAILGDGRAITLGEQLTSSGCLFDIQLKGSGRTPYSRGGDGLAALGPMLREALISETMHGLGIATTRSLAVVLTGDVVQRGTLLPGAVLARVASSHLRVGTFEYAAATGEVSNLVALVRYALARHFAHDSGSTGLSDSEAALVLLKSVGRLQADLIARWQSVGFVHGVMNTDNMTMSGETIDYGPCAFLDAHDPETVFSSIDHGGRYAFGRQPLVMLWNLERLAAALLPILALDDPERARSLAADSLNEAMAHYQKRWRDIMRAKLGLEDYSSHSSPAADDDLIFDLLGLMARHRADHTNTFLALVNLFENHHLVQGNDTQHGPHLAANEVTDWNVGPTSPSLGALFADPLCVAWQRKWLTRITSGPRDVSAVRTMLRSSNPRIIARNHAVEAVLQAALGGDFGPFTSAIRLLAQPFEPQGSASELLPWQQPAPPEAGRYQTFCGT